MPRTAPKIGSKQLVKVVPKPSTNAKSVDAELAEHLKQAEDHLIAAINLFSGPRRPDRVQGYLERLERAQIAITGLYREELVRIRGPIKNRRK